MMPSVTEALTYADRWSEKWQESLQAAAETGDDAKLLRAARHPEVLVPPATEAQIERWLLDQGRVLAAAP